VRRFARHLRSRRTPTKRLRHHRFREFHAELPLTLIGQPNCVILTAAMKPRSPTLEGFRTIFLRPSFGFAEIAWRWSFGAAAGLLLVFSCYQYLDTLPVSKADLLLLRTAQPLLISRAVLHIFRGSTFRAVETAIVLALALGVAWIVLASLARAATLKALITYFRESGIPQENVKTSWRLRSLFALNLFRLATTLAAVVGCFAAILLGGAVSRPTNPAPGSALLIILTVLMLIWFAWSTLNWFLSTAAIFVVADGRDTFAAIADTVNLCRARPGSISAAAIWFGLAHITAFTVTSSLAAFPLGFAAILPPAAVLGGVLVVAFIYFAIADFLYIGRLAAYLAMIEFPDTPVTEVLPTQGSSPDPRIHSSPAIDQSELILSDLPATT